jgi:hypothetical protein
LLTQSAILKMGRFVLPPITILSPSRPLPFSLPLSLPSSGEGEGRGGREREGEGRGGRGREGERGRGRRRDGEGEREREGEGGAPYNIMSLLQLCQERFILREETGSWFCPALWCLPLLTPASAHS